MASKNRKDHHYTEGELDFLRRNIDSMSYAQMGKELEKMTDQRYDKSAVHHICKRYGIKKTKRVVSKQRESSEKYHSYTQEETKYLLENFDKCKSYEELRTRFNEHFGLSIPLHSVQDMCSKRLKLKRGQNIGQFSKGKQEEKRLPIFSEVVHQGYIYIKIADGYDIDKNNTENYLENWMPKHRYVYEKTNGPIPNGNIVVFLDGNKECCEPENLYCIDRRIHVIMCKNQWYTSDRELTLTAIRWCELYYATH